MIPEVLHGTPIKLMARVQIAAALIASHVADPKLDHKTLPQLCRQAWRMADVMLEQEPLAAMTEAQIEEAEEKAVEEAKGEQK